MKKLISNPFESILKQLIAIEMAIKEQSNLKEVQLSDSKKSPPLKDFISKKEAAEIASVSVSTIDNLRRAGKLKPYYFGSLVRFKRAELMEYLESKGVR